MIKVPPRSMSLLTPEDVPEGETFIDNHGDVFLRCSADATGAALVMIAARLTSCMIGRRCFGTLPELPIRIINLVEEQHEVEPGFWETPCPRLPGSRSRVSAETKVD